MTRVKRGIIAHKKREKLLREVKGFKWGRKSKERFAKDALLHKWTNQFRSRKLKKRDFRRLWNVQVNAAARMNGVSYSKFVFALKKKNVQVDRKILSELAREHPEVFKKIVEFVL